MIIIIVLLLMSLKYIFIHFYAFCNTIIDVFFTLNYKYFVTYDDL